MDEQMRNAIKEAYLEGFRDGCYTIDDSSKPHKWEQEAWESSDALDVSATLSQPAAAEADSSHSAGSECDPVQRPWPTNAELALRRLLCLTFSRGLAYTDDGELSDSQRHPSIDFLRDAPAEIEAKIIQRNADTLTAPIQTVLLEHSGCGSNTQVDTLSVRLNPGDKVVLLKGRMTQGFDRADAAIRAKATP